MPIYFYPSVANNTFALDTIGYQWPQENVVRHQGHPHYHWLQSTEGQGTITLHNQTILLEPGMGILIPPFTPHCYQAIQQPWTTCFFTVTGEFTTLLPTILGTHYFYLAKDFDVFSFSYWVKSHAILTHSRLDFEVDMYRFFMHLREAQSQRENSDHPLYQTYIQVTLDWLKEHLAEDFQMQDLAKRLFISPQYLNRLFRRFLNQSLQQFVIDLRLQKAKELLVTRRKLKITDIAISVGYPDASYFAYLFKKNVGMTPQNFRQHY